MITNSPPKVPASGEGLSVTLRAPGHLPIAKSVPCHLYNSFGPFLPHQPEGLGDAEKSHSDITLLLVSTKEGTAGDRVYGLSMISVNPYQARVSSVEEAVEQLTTLVSSGPDWPYALGQLNGDTCHLPLPREGHLSILLEGGTNSATCGRVSQLLMLGLQVIYLVGLNGARSL